MSLVGICAYCREPVGKGPTVPPNRVPVMYGEGFYELREGGGANAFIGGVRSKSSKVWHRECAIRHRAEREGGVQTTLSAD